MNFPTNSKRENFLITISVSRKELENETRTENSIWCFDKSLTFLYILFSIIISAQWISNGNRSSICGETLNFINSKWHFWPSWKFTVTKNPNSFSYFGICKNKALWSRWNSGKTQNYVRTQNLIKKQWNFECARTLKIWTSTFSN